MAKKPIRSDTTALSGELHIQRQANTIAAVSMLVSAALAVASLIVSYYTAQKTEVLDRERVEIGNVTSNGNGPDFENRWRPWEQGLTTDGGGWIGVQRTIPFGRAFKAIPKISAGFSLINTPTPDVFLGDLLYRPEGDQERRRLRELHVVIDTDTITEKDFELRVGVGLNGNAGRFLKARLRDKDGIDAQLVDQMRRFSKIAGSFASLSEDEIWTINFYRVVGTLDVSWVAQGIDR